MITNRNTVPPLSEATVITERLSQIPSEKNVDIILLPNCGGVILHICSTFRAAAGSRNIAHVVGIISCSSVLYNRLCSGLYSWQKCRHNLAAKLWRDLLHPCSTFRAAAGSWNAYALGG